jgi:RHS repeat-associated protein
VHDAGGLLRLCCPALRPLRPVLLQPAFKLCDGTAEVVVARQENALGETVTLTDRNGTVHTLTYDVLGRLVSDAVTTLGAGVDGSVRRLEYGYDIHGNLAHITSYNAATGGSVVNQVKREFNGLGQLTSEWQQHGGVVTGSSPRVQYTYSLMAGGVNHSRRTGIIYPNGKVLNYNYASGIDNAISRLSSLSDSTGTLESYDYLGESVVVARKHPQPGVDLSYIKRAGEANGDAGDPYTGLDRFGRIVDQRWLKSTTGSAVDRLQYTYDRNGNRLSRTNLINTAFSESYSYDNLNQLIGFTRGSHSRSWDYDAQGNWEGVTTNGSTQMRTHNAQNEITGISGATTPTYDANGNLTRDETGRQFVYDAWNRLVAVKDAVGTTLKSYAYDGLHRRVQETASGTTTDLYYSDAWQVLEERVGGQARVQYVWSPVYVDALVLRDRDTNGDGTLDERLWVVQDANYNVTVLFDNSGNVVERYIYDPFGSVTVLDTDWTERSGGSEYAWHYLHQGGRFDDVSGLYHFRYRDYSPTLGRWTSLDPLGYAAGDVNLHRTVFNAPTVYTDPSGLEGPGYHHFYPLFLGGSDNQPLFPLTAEEHTAAHKVLRKYNVARTSGISYDQARANWKMLTPQQQRAIILECFDAANIPRTLAEKYIDQVCAGATPGINNSPLRNKTPRRAQLVSRFEIEQARKAAGFAQKLGTTVIVGGLTFFYGQAVQAGEESGIKLAEKIGLGRILQIYGDEGLLPSTHFKMEFRGRVINVELIRDPSDSQAGHYITAYYLEEINQGYWGWFKRIVTLGSCGSDIMERHDIIKLSDNYKTYGFVYKIP